MASASGPGEVLQASEGKTRFFRLTRLLICGGTTVMRELFDYLIPPANLAAVLSSPAVKTRLNDMRNKKILTSPQWDKLYPPFGSVQSASFDITLLFKLLRENMISGLSAPSKGWDDLPNISDMSLPADMARLKYYRNDLAHGDEKMELSEQEFSDYWKEIKDALVRIVGHYATSGSSTVKDWETAIDRLLTEPLTEDDRKRVADLSPEELRSCYLESRLETLLGQQKKEKPKSETSQKAVSAFKDIIEEKRLWFPIRESSIRLMRETADELDGFEGKVDHVKYYAAFIGICGVALLGAGALANFLTMGAAALLIWSGVAATVGSAVVSGGADITWLVSNKGHLDQVEKVWKEDRAKQEEASLKVKNLQDLIKQISEEENITKEEALKNMVKTFLNPLYFNVLRHYWNLVNEITLIFTYIDVLFKISTVYDISGAVVVGSSLGGTAVRGVITNTTPILAALNAYQLYTSNNSIAKGSKSKAAEKLRETARDLERELYKYKDCVLPIYR